MKRLYLAITMLLISLQLSSALAQQAPPLGPQAAPAPKGTITGTVVKATTGEPIARAQVTVTRLGAAPNPAGIDATPDAGARAGDPSLQDFQQLQIIPAVLTDDQGTFAIKDLPPGSYRVAAVRNGYSRQEFGQHSIGRPGTVLNVRAGQTVPDVSFRLTPAATIAGRVIDTNGDPLPGISIQALRSTYDATGKRSLQPVGVAKTNDLGEYRLYWMNPGRYFINANASPTGLEALSAMSSQAAAAAPPPSTPEEEQILAQSQSILGPGKNPNEANNSGFVVIYYPNTPDPARAAAVELQPGAEVRGMDFTLTRDQKVRIRGKIMDAGTGKPPQMAQVSVTPRTGSGGSPMDILMGLGGALQGNTYNPATGEFEARDVSSGSYLLQITSMAQMPVPAAGGRGTAPGDAADPLAAMSSLNTTQVPIDVYGTDIENVNVTVSSGITIPGRLRMDGGPPPTVGNANTNPYDRYSVSLQSGSGGPDIFAILSGGGGKPAADGTFSLPRIKPGNYKVSVSGIGPNMYIKEARLDQMDVLAGATIGDRVNGALEVTLSPNAGQLDGKITDKLSKPLTGVQAVLIPDKSRERRELYKMAVTDMEGHFTIRGLAPGNYKLFAWEDIEPFSYFDADVLNAYDSKGTPVSIRESSKETVEMKIIPATVP